MAKRTNIDTPSHLRTPTSAWFKRVTEDFVLEPHHIRLLTLASEAWDRCQQAREAIDTNGLTYNDRFGAPRMRPEVAIERDSRIAFARLLRELALDVDEPDDSRPPTIVGKAHRRT